jgi:hypothetical protein
MKQKPENCSPIRTSDPQSMAGVPDWARAIMLAEPRSPSLPKGRILKLKLGYNPNSSSVGSGVYVLPILLLGVSVLFGAVAGLISAAFAPGKRKAQRGVASHAPPPMTRSDGE